MSLAGRNRRPITAAAQRIGYSQVTAEKLRDQPWQERAWDVYDKLGPIYYMTRYRSAVARKVDYFAGRKDSPGTDPDNDVTLDDEGEISQLGPATKVLEAEGGPELIRRIVSELMVHWDVAGEAYLVRFEEGPFWRVLSTQELKSKKGNYLWDQAPPGMGEIDGDNVYRVWKPHPRQHWQADSPTRHVLEDAEGLILSGREIRARSMSRLSAGILLVPDTLDLSPFAEDEEGTEDDVARWLTNILAGPVKDPGSTQGIAPAVMTMNGADIALVRHMTFDREWDVSIELREEQLNHVALGIDMPPELATGTAGSMNHWGSWWLTDEAVNMHVLPTVDDILDSLSMNWFRPLLEAASVDPESYVIWRDPSAATVPTDRSDVALKMFELGAISGEALRRVTDFDEEDAPGEDDVVPGESADSPEGVPQNGPPPPPVQGGFDALVAAVLERLKEGGPPLADAAVTAATRRRIVATELADIDSELLAWVVTEADKEIDRLLIQVGVTAATDPLDESLLARFGQRVEAQIAKAQERARGWVERLTGRRIPGEQLSLFRRQGVQVILDGVLEAVRRRLFTPQGGPDPIDTGKIADILPPTSAIREGLSLAGGGPAVYEDGHTSELIGNGQFIQDELRQDGFVPELMVWRHGGPAHPFEPHRSLNGTEFDSWDSPKLTATERWGRIGEHYKPDDHDGCTCSVEMLLVARAEAGVQSGTRPDEPTPPGPPLTWEQFGVKLAKDPAQRKLLEDALQRLNGLEPAVRDRFVMLLRQFDGKVDFEVATAATEALEDLGRVSYLSDDVGQFLPTGHSMTLQLFRQVDSWDEWSGGFNAESKRAFRELSTLKNPDGSVMSLAAKQAYLDQEVSVWKGANPEPDKWRLASPDELADVLVHELSHTNDVQQMFETGSKVVDRLTPEIKEKVWELYWGGPRTGTNPLNHQVYEYATEGGPAEMVAELHRFYLRGVYGGDIKLTAAEWRGANPELANWVRESLLL